MSGPLATALAAFVTMMVPACWESDGCHIASHCEGDDLHFCAGDIDTGMAELTTHCADRGQACRQTGATVACVFLDQPCVANTCKGNLVGHCSAIGLIDSYDDCAHDEPGRSCVPAANGAACGYPAVTCPDSGADPFCGPDDGSLYSGCTADKHPAHAEACSGGNICTTAGGAAVCADPELIPCTTGAKFFCSADASFVYFCRSGGLAWRSDDCGAQEKMCVAGRCALEH